MCVCWWVLCIQVLWLSGWQTHWLCPMICCAGQCSDSKTTSMQRKLIENVFNMYNNLKDSACRIWIVVFKHPDEISVLHKSMILYFMAVDRKVHNHTSALKFLWCTGWCTCLLCTSFNVFCYLIVRGNLGRRDNTDMLPRSSATWISICL